MNDLMPLKYSGSCKILDLAWKVVPLPWNSKFWRDSWKRRCPAGIFPWSYSNWLHDGHFKNSDRYIEIILQKILKYALRRVVIKVTLGGFLIFIVAVTPGRSWTWAARMEIRRVANLTPLTSYSKSIFFSEKNRLTRFIVDKMMIMTPFLEMMFQAFGCHSV